MPSCCAGACRSRSEKGFKMYRFPRDPVRQKDWVANVQNYRQTFQPTVNSYLCEVHFDDMQFEPRRADKKLKRSAVPTLFLSCTASKLRMFPLVCPEPITKDPSTAINAEHTYSAAPPKSSHERKVVRISSILAKLVHSAVPPPPCSLTEDSPTCKEVGVPTTILADHPQSAFPYVSPHSSSEDGPPCKEVSVPTTILAAHPQSAFPYESPQSPSIDAQVTTDAAPMTCWTTPDTRPLTMENKLKLLKLKVRKLRKEKKALLKSKAKQEANVSKLFGKDQLEALSRGGMRGVKWSSKTVKKAIQLRYACGARGYHLLLQQNYPLPSIRTLERRMEKLSFLPGLLCEVFNFIDVNEVQGQEEVSSLDEMLNTTDVEC